MSPRGLPPEGIGMSETMQIFFMFLLLIGTLLFVLRIAGWKMKKAVDAIIGDLREQQALSPASAVALPYSKADLFHIGLRDYRPKALVVLVRQDVVRLSDEGKYYLREGHALNLSGQADSGGGVSHP
jgi:hypothetical protein